MKGSLIISGDSAGRVFFWNKVTGQAEAAIQAHEAPIHRVAYLAGRFYTASGLVSSISYLVWNDFLNFVWSGEYTRHADRSVGVPAMFYNASMLHLSCP